MVESEDSMTHSGAIRGGLLVLAWLATAPGVLAQAPAPTRMALVLELAGATTPALKPYREIVAGTTVTLTPSSRIVFFHYDTCQTFTVTGGTVAFGHGEMPLIQGAVSATHVRSRCPRRIAGSGGSAATVFRSGTAHAPTLSLTPSFVLVGRRAEEFARVRILRDGKEVLDQALSGPRFEWPTEKPALMAGTHQLVLRPDRADAQPLTIMFNATPRPVADVELTMITVD
jgi:hypothetical protein